jgi:hypothetical protein
MSIGVEEYKGHWIRCFAMPQTSPGGLWECVVRVYVFPPTDVEEPAEDHCFRAVVIDNESADGAVVAGLVHAQGIIDRRLRK